MLTNTIHYFAGGNTAQGFVDYLASNLQGLEKLLILKGGTVAARVSIINAVGAVFDENEICTEQIHSYSDPELLDAIIIPKLNIAIVDGTAQYIIEPIAPDASAEYVNLGAALDIMQLKEYKDEILILNDKIKKCFGDACRHFSQGLTIHDEWEKIYIKNMNFSKADILISEIINLVLSSKMLPKKSIVKHRFFGASTPQGSINFIEDITSNISKRYLIKGRPGTGKSTLLKKTLSTATQRGFDAEVYHCAFDSGSLDMLVLPELDICIFDSTDPHLYEPDRQSDEVIDMYERCVKPNTDKKYNRKIQEISARYKSAVQSGIQALAEAKKLQDELEKYYIDAADLNVINTLQDEIISYLMELINT